MNIDAVIFDLDGTLIDSIPDIAGAANKMLRNNRYPEQDVNDYIAWIGHGARQLISKALPDGLDKNTFEKCLKEFLEIYWSNCTVKTKIYEGIHEVLDDLEKQHIPMSVLTNKPHDLTKIIIDYYFKHRNFYAVYGQRIQYPRKPDPTVALNLASQLGIDTESILFIGDSDTDIKTAIAAGMIPGGVSWGYGSVSSMMTAGSKYMFNIPADIIGLLR